MGYEWHEKVRLLLDQLSPPQIPMPKPPVTSFNINFRGKDQHMVYSNIKACSKLTTKLTIEDKELGVR